MGVGASTAGQAKNEVDNVLEDALSMSSHGKWEARDTKSTSSFGGSMKKFTYEGKKLPCDYFLSI